MSKPCLPAPTGLLTNSSQLPRAPHENHEGTEAEQHMRSWMTALFAAACGFTVANLYYAQPLIGLIAGSLGMQESAASFIVTLAQLGYCVGLIFLVPLGDLVENRRLVVCAQGALVLALVTAALSPTSGLFLMAMTVVGVSAVAAQMLLPIAAHMTQESNRGHVIGTVMSGLLMGVLLARPVSILIADAFGWRVVFAGSAALMMALSVLLWRCLPVRYPSASHGYARLIRSLWSLWRTTPVLRQRAIYQACLFAAFTLFWTTIPLQLASQPFHLSQASIALFSLAGALGAVAAPIAGRLADRGWGRAATGASLVMVALALLLAAWGARGELVALVAASVLLDVGVQVNLVIGQRTIYSLSPDQRSRLNGIYIAVFFAGGAVGSALASLLFSRGGGELVSGVALIFPLMALVIYATNWRDQ